MDKLGVMYLNGQGVATDYKKALNWFSKQRSRDIHGPSII